MSLIDRIKRGENAAILEFYRSFSPRILIYLERRVPKEIAQEILNDVFLDALDEIPLLKHEQNVMGWLYRIARNKTIDYYRKRKLKSVLFSQIPYLEFAAKEMTQPEFVLEKEKVREKIEGVMSRISTKYAMILRMHYEDGMRVKEIALELNMTPKATESLLFRARMKFIEEYDISSN
ncbi:MAG: RNA polymerase sigma factor [bacterium]|nr:RNA polymerase sigma factor [bacterium]